MTESDENIPNPLTTEPIPKLIRSIALPAFVGFFFNTMYNVVDTYFAGSVSTEALAALSLSFPVFFIIIALSSGIATGSTAIIANALGTGDKVEARHSARQSISYGILISIALTIVGLLIAEPLFRILGAEGQYLETALIYIRPIFAGAIFFVFNWVFNAILNSIGDTKTFRNFLIVGFFLNVILDPLFIFGWGPFPALGIVGVAWATVLIEIIGATYLGYKVWLSGMISGFNLSSLIPEKKAYKDISAQGLPTGLSMMAVAIGVFVITYFISTFGKGAVAAYGIATRIEQIALLPMFGLNIAAITLIGQNNGAKLFGRVSEVVSKTFKYAFWVAAISTVLLLISAPHIMRVFTSDQVVIDFGVPYLRIAAFLFYGYAVLFLTDAVFRGLKKPLYPLVMGIMRQIIAPFALFYTVISIFETSIFGIWWSIFGMIIVAAIISYSYMRYTLDKVFKTS